MVGLLGLAELAPLLVTAFLGGALADAIDRRRLVLLTELLADGDVRVLLANSLVGEPKLWVLFVVAAVMAGLDGLQRPPLDALTPRLVEREELTAAARSTRCAGRSGMVAGPAIGGVLIAAVRAVVDVRRRPGDVRGLARSAWRDARGAAAARRRAAEPALDRRGLPLRDEPRGARRHLQRRHRRDVLRHAARALPALAADLGGAGVLGLLYAAPSVGAALATLTSGWTARVHRHGLAVLLAAAGWGAGIVVCGLAPSVALACGGLVVAGFADMLSGIFRSTIWNQTIPDRLRGRLAGIEQISYSTGPLLGNVEAGIVASLTSVRTSIVSGGVLCVVAVPVVALLLPGFRRYDSPRRGAGLGFGAMPDALYFTDDLKACKLLADDPFALLVGSRSTSRCRCRRRSPARSC